jgi:hypothetical protein
MMNTQRDVEERRSWVIGYRIEISTTIHSSEGKKYALARFSRRGGSKRGQSEQV